jgi:phospholipase C
MRPIYRRLVGTVAAMLALFTTVTPATAASTQPSTTTPIKHFTFMMQGDRTFDNYFGSFPGADGIPEGTCQELVVGQPAQGCVKPFVLDKEASASLTAGPSLINRQWNNGAMNRFVAAFHTQGRDGTNAMGHYDGDALSFYWSVAQNYVLFDRFFASSRQGEAANRNYWVSAASPVNSGTDQRTVFDGLEDAGVSWKFYVENYQDDENYRTNSVTSPTTQQIRVPLLNQSRFIDDPKLSAHIVDLNEYYTDLAAGTLPAVAYVATHSSSERSGRSVQAGQNLARNMVTQLMLSNSWASSAFLISYDGPGGWYDHVAPPQIDANGYGLRVPGLLISPYTATGAVDSTVFDATSGLRFISENWGLPFLSSRDSTANSLASAFDFQQAPRPAAVLPPLPAPTVATRGAAGAVYWTYGSAAAVIAFCLVLAAMLPWSRRLMAMFSRGRHRSPEPIVRTP